jgi:hypothetical protein
MKFKIHIAFAFALFILFSVTNASRAEKVTQKFPSAFVPVDSYEFAPVVDGTEITHDFVIQNKGTAPLKIETIKID